MICNYDFRVNKKTGLACAATFCTKPELIENYDLAIVDKTQTWICHHRLETHNSDGKRRLVALESEELIALGIYYNRPPEELIFLTPAEHRVLHNSLRDYSKVTEEARQNISKAQKLRASNMTEEERRSVFGSRKGQKQSEEERQKRSISIRNTINKMSDKERKEKYGRDPWNKKKVLCVETGIVYSSITKAESQTKSKNISMVCNGQRKTANGYHWQFVN